MPNTANLKNKTAILMIIPILVILFIASFNLAHSQTTGYNIPSWIKDNAGLWATNQISDDDFLKGIKYMITQSIIIIPHPQSSATQQIPSWIKHDAKWWAAGQIGDEDFVNGMQFLVANNIIHVTMNSQSNPTSTEPSRISLLFVNWPDAQDAPQVESLMEKYLTQTNDYSHIKNDNFYLKFPNQRQFFVGDSISAVTSLVSKAPTISLPVYAIAYDFEHWTATPASEQADPAGSMATASDIVRKAGYKFAYAPDQKFLSSLYSSIDWTKVDIAWLQTGGNAKTYSSFVTFETSVINQIRSVNPHAIIIVQLNLAVMKDPAYSDPVSQYNAEVDYLVNNLKPDGLSVVYTTPDNSPNFTIPNLQAILAHVTATTPYVHN